MFSFYKMQVAGNDFILVDFMKKKLEYSFKLLSKFLCDRHFGVGADNTLILERSELVDFKFRIFNKNGEESKISGNGILCVAKYIYENKLINKKEFEIETKLGIKKVMIEEDNSSVEDIEVDLGEANFDFQNIPVIYLESNYQGVVHLENINVYPVFIGEPYVIHFVDDISKTDVKNLGKLIENYKYFPSKTNIEFVQIIDNENIKIRTWKINVGETLSSGTGSCAAAAVSNRYKFTNCIVTVNSLGGKLKVNCEKNIKLKGRVENIFYGNIMI